MVGFVDREYELGELEKLWREKSAAFVVLYGRRRVGKSRLIQEFLNGKKSIYFIAEDNNKKVQIAEFKKKVAEFFNDSFLLEVQINEWSELFEYLKKIVPSNEKLCIAIDEFSYFVKNDHAILSVLQKFWDIFLSKTKVVFLVSGSIFGLMSEQVLSSASPLYGRRDRDFLLLPFTHKDSLIFLKMKNEDMAAAYFSIGGVPEYLLKASRHSNSNDFFAAEFFKKDGYFYREPYYLLSQEFKEIKTYFTILNAISFGNTKPTDIANFAGVKTREIYPYLESLIRLNFVRREISIFGKRQNGIYSIKDALFDFWFNFVYQNRESIEKGFFEADKNSLETFFGKRFEIMVREEIAHLAVPFKFEKIGRWWFKDKEIDIVAFSEKTSEIFFAECKWKNNVNAMQVVKELSEKTKFVQWNTNGRKEYFAIFAKSFSKKITEFEGKKVICLDLPDILKK